MKSNLSGQSAINHLISHLNCKQINFEELGKHNCFRVTASYGDLSCQTLGWTVPPVE